MVPQGHLEAVRAAKVAKMEEETEAAPEVAKMEDDSVAAPEEVDHRSAAPHRSRRSR